MEITDLICKSCFVALMYEHPEDKKWLKCCLCGYCVPTKEKQKSDIVKK